MKKLLLSLVVIASSYMTFGQVILSVESPASISGNMEFSWADPQGGDWATPDFTVPGTYIQACLEMVEDGTAGTNPQGNPVSQEGCSPLTNSAANGNDLTGKIAVCYRNTCEFGLKALNAQNAGAIGIIIINRDPEVIQMGGGTEGLNVTIPVAMVSSTDGQTLVTEMANGCVDVFLGNKTGLYANDAGITADATLIPSASGVPVQLASNATEFNFDLGTRVYNYGNQAQNSVSLNASIDGPTGNVYSETVSGIAIPVGDSVDVFPGGSYSLPQFGLATYPEGRYTLTYSVSLGATITDEYASDNVRQVDFIIQDSIYTLAGTDLTTNRPVSNNGFRPSTNTSTFSQCIVFDDANGSRVTVEGLYFSATTATDATTGNPIDLSGEEIALYVYRWEDVFTDLNDANLAFNSLSPVGVGYYYYPSDLQGETVYGELDSPVALEDAQRFLMCAQTVNLDLYLGFDTERNYLWNEAYYLQPLGPIESDGSYFASGFGMEYVPAIGAKMGTVGVSELATVDGIAFPNPATDVVTINVEATGNATLTVTDIAGRTAMTTNVGLANGTAEVNIEALESGVYVFNVAFEDGRTSQFNVVKK